MRNFNYKDRWNELLTPEIVTLISQIHEQKGQQSLFVEANPDKLNELLTIAKIQSTEASNKIEGIYTSNTRLKNIVLDKTMPRSRNEQEIAGYRDVLSTIHESYDYIPPTPNMFLQLHKNLYKFNGSSIGGKYKSSDNIIAQEDAEGNHFIRFKPVSAWETPEAMSRMCEAYRTALDYDIDPLFLIPMFLVDFLCIHPFNDGNGRMSRLLTLLLLYRSGYTVGKYISIEKLIEQSKETYYEALHDSSVNWHEGNNDYAPFVKYMLGVILAAYRDFSTRAGALTQQHTKAQMVEIVIQNSLSPITKSEIAEQLSQISNITIQRTLADLLKENKIIKLSGGRYTKYIWNREGEK